MLINSIDIENFKPFGEKQTALLAPITLIFGPNSSGKSSLIQSLLLLKQTLSNKGYNFNGLVPRGEYIDLGSYSSLIHMHEIERQLKIKLDYSYNNHSRRNWNVLSMINNQNNISVKMTYQAANSQGSSKKDSSDLAKTRFEVNGKNAFTLKAIPNEQNELGEISYELENDDSVAAYSKYTTDVLKKLRHALPEPNFSTKQIRAAAKEVRFLVSGLVPSQVKPRAVAGAPSPQLPTNMLSLPMSAVAQSLNELLESVLYLGPLRVHPTRHYLITGGEKRTVGTRGENTLGMIFRNESETKASINQWFKQFEIPYELTIKRLSDEITGDIIAVQLIDQRTKVKVSQSDVGFGIGQLLPIIVQGGIAKEMILCVEQPEIHLHPRLQAHIADFLIQTAGLTLPKRRKLDFAPKNQWIVETHSESLMLRIQKRIRQQKISHRDVSILYVELTDSGDTKIHQLRLDDSGEFIDEWPHGFFEDDFYEMFDGIED